MMLVIDDLGWNNVPWHNKDLEATMPVSLSLVREGVEVDRHYAFLYCSPSRSSLLSGRLPYHVNQINLAPGWESSGIAKGMTTIPRKLRGAGYATHAVGKWHCGCASPAHTPHGRGFDTHLGYFAGAEDHYTQRQCIDNLCNQPDDDPSNFVDLWLTDAPAHGRNGTYGDAMFTAFAVAAIAAHPAGTPAFLYVALQNNHEPLQVPRAYSGRFPADWAWDRRMYAGMGAYWDEAVGNITGALRRRGMWEDTLLVMTSDNGGPVYPSTSVGYDHCGGANNWPLFGGKSSNWEGGVRVSAFVSGGFLPSAVRGTKLEGNVHIADWYATFCGLAGVDPADAAAGVPQVDSIDAWPLLTGQNATSPRWEIPLSVTSPNGAKRTPAPDPSHPPPPTLVSALIQGEYKLIGGLYWSSIRQAQAWPVAGGCCNYTCWTEQVGDCGTAGEPTCLFDIRSDPSETHNIAGKHADVVARMTARLKELEREVYDPQSSDALNASAQDVWREEYGGFVGPWLP